MLAVIAPPNGRVPDWTPSPRERSCDTRNRSHDSYQHMKSGDRCITREVLGMMMPTAYNNGTLILRIPGYVVLHSEMIHNARIIPINGQLQQAKPLIPQWDTNPHGRWEANTLIVNPPGTAWWTAYEELRPYCGRGKPSTNGWSNGSRSWTKTPCDTHSRWTTPTRSRGQSLSRYSGMTTTCNSSTPATKVTTRCRTRYGELALKSDTSFNIHRSPN